MIPLGDDVRRRGPYVATLVLIAANVVAFLLSAFYGVELTAERSGFRPVYLLAHRRLETILTSLFLHADILHLAGNMVYLFIFGRSVEGRLGPLLLFLTYIASGVAGALLHSAATFVLPPQLARELVRPLIGASGAISGLLGAYTVFYPHARVATLVPFYYILVIRVPARFYVAAWFAYQLAVGLVGLRQPLQVAAWAHVGGFAAGAAIALALEGVTSTARPRTRVA